MKNTKRGFESEAIASFRMMWMSEWVLLTEYLLNIWPGIVCVYNSTGDDWI